MKSIGKNLQRIRRERGLTQEQFAELLGVSTNHLSSVERGEHQFRVETLVKAINILGCSADDIFCDVLDNGIKIKNALLLSRIEALPEAEQKRILALLQVMLDTSPSSEQSQ